MFFRSNHKHCVSKFSLVGCGEVFLFQKEYLPALFPCRNSLIAPTSTLCTKVFLGWVREGVPFSKGTPSRLYYPHTKIFSSSRPQYLCIKVFFSEGAETLFFVKRKGFPLIFSLINYASSIRSLASVSPLVSANFSRSICTVRCFFSSPEMSKTILPSWSIIRRLP